MKTESPNHQKKMAKLFYQDKIYTMHQDGASLQKITDAINKQFIPRSKYKGVTLSKSTIRNVIAFLKKKRR